MAKSVKKKSKSKPADKKAIDGLDRIFHEKARLSILTFVIAESDGISFNHLKTQCDLTDGNLNSHLKVLLDANVLKVKKTGQGRSTNSVYHLTSFGRKAFEDYLNALESVVKAAQGAARKTGVQTNVAISPK